LKFSFFLRLDCARGEVDHVAIGNGKVDAHYDVFLLIRWHVEGYKIVEVSRGENGSIFSDLDGEFPGLFGGVIRYGILENGYIGESV
jgi:hypothetical protein